MNKIGLYFMLAGLAALLASLLFGIIGALQFLNPEFLPELAFNQTRPLHVTLAVTWIFLGAVGGIYYYLPNFCRLKLWSPLLAKLHLWVFLANGLAILWSYLAGKFGGREYFEFPVFLAIPILFAWVLFGINYFMTLRKHNGPWPVYFWMWGTGIVFFLLTFSEAYLWLIPYFRENMVRELTVQWKSYGALIGSWNMLVYGTAIFVMSRIQGGTKTAHSKIAFGLYFLALFNMMFGWAHHAYPVPSAIWIREFAYIVSMTELLILGKIIWDWRGTLTAHRKHQHRNASRFMFAADFWVFTNLILAIVISVPAANLFTHGTHVTVAHAMGTTIGINTMILLASVCFIIEEGYRKHLGGRFITTVNVGIWIANISLGVFWLALLGAGLVRGTYKGPSFSEMMSNIEPYLIAFIAAGFGLLVGLCLILGPAIHHTASLVFKKQPAGE